MDTHNQNRYHGKDIENDKNEIGNRDDLDSKVNTDFTQTDGDSLTNDESADTDPNTVNDKPKFKNDDAR